MGGAGKYIATFQGLEKLRDHTNWIPWNKSVKDILVISRLWSTVEAGLVAAPGDNATEAAIEKYTKSVENNAIVVAYLRVCVDSINSRRLDDISDAKIAWSTLKDANQPKGFGHVHEAINHFMSLRMDQCSDLKDYCNKFQDRYARLSQFKGKIILDEVFLVSIFHNNLTSDFRHYVNSYNEDNEPFTDKEPFTANVKLTEAITKIISYKASDQNVVGGMAYTTFTTAAPVKPLNPGAPVRLPQQTGVKAGHCKDIVQTVHYCHKPGCKYPYRHSTSGHRSDFQAGRKRPDSSSDNRDSKRQKEDKSDKPSDDYRTGNKGSAKPVANVAIGGMGVDTSHAYSAHTFAGGCLPTWIFDTGATYHFVGDRRVFTELVDLEHPMPVSGVTGGIESRAIGTITVPCRTPDGTKQLIVDNVFYCPGLKINLISSAKLHRAGCPLQYICDGPLGISIGRQGIVANLLEADLYLLDVNLSEDPAARALYVNKRDRNEDAMKMYHEIFGHMGMENVARLPEVADGVDLTSAPTNTECCCVTCAETRMKALSHKGHLPRGKYVNELVHADIVEVLKGGSQRYAHCFVEDVSRFAHVFFRPNKDAESALSAFQDYRALIERGEAKIRRVKSDHDRAYNAGVMLDYRLEHGIVWIPSIPDNPQQNGVMERNSQTIMQRAFAFQRDSGLEERWLPDLVDASVFLYNRAPHAGLNTTPLEAFGGGRPDLSFVRRIGRKGMCQKRHTTGRNWPKFETRAEEGTLVGFIPHGGYLMIVNGRKAHMIMLNGWAMNALLSRPNLNPQHQARGKTVRQDLPLRKQILQIA